MRPLFFVVFALAYGCSIESRPTDDEVASARRATSETPARPARSARFFELVRVSEAPATGFHAIETNNTQLLVSDEPIISNLDVASARAVDDGSGSAKIELVWTAEGRRKFAAATRDLQGQTLALIIDGHLETMLAFDHPMDEPSVQIGKGDAATMATAAEFAARFNAR